MRLETWEILALMGISIPILSIILSFVKDMFKIRNNKYMHLENIERMRSGFPPLGSSKSEKKVEKRAERREDEIIDLTGTADTVRAGNEN